MQQALKRATWVLPLAGIGLLAGCGRGAAAPTPVAADAAPVVGVVRVTRQNLSRTLSLAAEFKPFQDIAVDAKVAGYVKTMYVDVGDRVHTGELLAVLEVPELQDQITQAGASVEQNVEGVQRAQDLLAQAQASAQDAQLEYTRLNGVTTTQPGLVAQQEVDDAHGKDLAAQAQVEAARAALAEARQQLAVSQAALKRLQTMFAYARITAPFDGVITHRFADTGAMIQAGTTQAMPVVQLAEEGLLRLGIPVPESAVPLIHLGMPAQVQVPSLNRTFEGKVARFSDQVAFDTRTMYTEIDVPNPSGLLVPGMYAYATLTLDQRPNALAVPVQALTQNGGGTTVTVIDGQRRAQTRTVRLGLQTPNAAEVLSGLQPGEEVVVSGASLLRPGEIVQPKLVTLPTNNTGSAGAQ